MKKYLIAAFALSVMLSACKKEDNCPTNKITCLNGGAYNSNSCECDCANGFTGIDCSVPPAQACATQHYGEIAIYSSKNDPYEVRVNGSYKGNISANGSKFLTNFPSGSVNIQVTQASGYVFYPSVYSTNGTVYDCYQLNWSF